MVLCSHLILLPATLYLSFPILITSPGSWWTRWSISSPIIGQPWFMFQHPKIYLAGKLKAIWTGELGCMIYYVLRFLKLIFYFPDILYKLGFWDEIKIHQNSSITKQNWTLPIFWGCPVSIKKIIYFYGLARPRKKAAFNVGGSRKNTNKC